MDTDRTRSQVAEPAEEELKKHGDQLKTQVADAAGKHARDGVQQGMRKEAERKETDQDKDQDDAQDR